MSQPAPLRRRLARVAAVVGTALLLLAVAPRALAGEGRALDEYFKGRVVALDGNTVTLKYDFREKAQLEDFLDRVPFRIKPRKGQGIQWFDSKLEIVGNTGARHKAEWMGDVLVTATWIPDLEKDFGGTMSPVSETEDFVTFTFVETYFHAFDGQAGGTNSIIKFGAQWRETDSEEFIGFRYGMRRPPRDKIQIGKSFEAGFGRTRGKLIFRTPDGELKSAEKGKKLKRYHLGFYAINGRLLIDNVVIQGTLATDWLRRENVQLRTVAPVGADAADVVDEATQALIDEHKAGKSSKATRALVDVLKDDTLGEATEAAVMGALSAGPKKAVRHALDLLYHVEPKVRARGIQIIKSLLGSDFGYKPKGSEKSRTTALRKLNKELQDNPGLLEG